MGFNNHFLFFIIRLRLTVEQALNHEWFKKWDIKSKIAEFEAATTTTTTSTTIKSETKSTTIEMKKDCVSIDSTKIIIENENINNKIAQTTTTTTTTNSSSSNSTYSFHQHLQQIQYLYNQVLNDVDDSTTTSASTTIKGDYLKSTNEQNSIATAAL